MAKQYTAYQMRVASKACEELVQSMVAEMLRQAADAIEREEREKKYEYACFGRVFQTLNVAKMHSIANEIRGQRPTIVRREVGEWREVVTNDNN